MDTRGEYSGGLATGMAASEAAGEIITRGERGAA